MTYLITFACYGCHLHGDEVGSVDREHNLYRSRLVAADPKRALAQSRRMDQPPYDMDQIRRDAVLARCRSAVEIVTGLCLPFTCALITCTSSWMPMFRRNAS